MKKLLLILLTIPLISFAEEPIYFDCKFTCERSTFYGESEPMDGCQGTFENRNKRSTHESTYKYYKDKQELYHWDVMYKCENSKESPDMHCHSMRGVKWNNPVPIMYGENKGKPSDDWLNENYVRISRSTLKAFSKIVLQTSEDSRLVFQKSNGSCEMNKAKF
jgi:hypothetical protein